MRKKYDDFLQLKLKDMSKSISDMTYTYINPETEKPTKVPATHYEKILNEIEENYIADAMSRQFLIIVYNQLTAIKKEDEKYFKQALLCMDIGINPKDLRVNEQIALQDTYDYLEEKQKKEKKAFHLLNKELIDFYEEAKSDDEFHKYVIENMNLN